MTDIKIPIIDCTPIAKWAFEDGPIENYSEVAKEIGAAMTGIGMCNLVNHGVSKEKVYFILLTTKR